MRNLVTAGSLAGSAASESEQSRHFVSNKGDNDLPESEACVVWLLHRKPQGYQK